METTNLKVKLGVALLAVVFSLNAIHAFNDYGVKENKLNYEVMEQSSTTGGGSTGGVKCRCGLIWGEGCKANNYGSTCVTDVEQCWSYNQNCN